jgi:two-component system cell cycle response regulator CpdR
VTPAEDGAQAYDILQKELQDKPHDPFVMLLADIVMPGMDGIELSQKAAQLDSSLKIMFITGFAAVAMGQKINDQAHAPRVLSKPFHLNDLVKQVNDLLAA